MRVDLPPAPPGIAALPLDNRGFPIPWFVHVDENGPDFRILGAGKMGAAVRKQLCWICGRHLGRLKSFVIGPMCSVNRISAEPPSHPQCAVYAAQACPFLSHPMAKRPDRPTTVAVKQPAGIMLEHNPGVTLVWGTLSYRTIQANGGVLFQLGAPERTQWFAHGREATADEVLAGFALGLPRLRAIAEAEGPEAVAELAQALSRAMHLLPKAA
jgi:hypothetical protein